MATEKTEFSIDTYGRYISNTLDELFVLKNGQLNEYECSDVDVIIIGSGMYGGYLATHLNNKGIELKTKNTIPFPLKILVLEAGPFVLSEHEQNQNVFIGNGANRQRKVTDNELKDSQDEVWGWNWVWNKDIIGYVPTAFCIGGKSLFWGGWCPRMTESDLIKWPEDVRNYMINQTFSRVDKLPYKDPIWDKNLKGTYSLLEFEIGVKPGDDFIFDPKEGLIEGSLPKKGLNQFVHEKLKSIISNNKFSDNASVEDDNGNPVPRVAVQTQSSISGVASLDKYSSLPGLIRALVSDEKRKDGKNARIALVPNTKVTKFINNSSVNQSQTNTIRKIEVSVKGQKKYLNIPDSCQVVLAANTIESTRLALASFPHLQVKRIDEKKLEIQNKKELMGSNLMVHFRFDLYFRIKKENLGDLSERLQTAISHIQFDNPTEGRYHFQFYAAYSTNNNPDDFLYKMFPDYNTINQINLLRANPGDYISFAIRTCGEMKGLLSKENIDIANYNKLTSGDNYINLSPFDVDNVGNIQRPFVFLNAKHYNDPIWQSMYDNAVSLSQELAKDKSKVEYLKYENSDFANKKDNTSWILIPPKLNIDKNFNTGIGFKQSLGSTYHEAGTLWMGDNPETSITDVNGHFHQVSNLYCCDQSLFPTIGSANPVLTGLTLARKVGDDILSRHLSDDFDFTKLIGFTDLLKTPLDWENIKDSIQDNNFKSLKIENSIISVNSLLEGNLGIFWFKNKRYKNFELYVQWRVERTYEGEVANSGIFLRMPDIKTFPKNPDLNDPKQTKYKNLVDKFYDQFIEVQIDESGKNYLRIDDNSSEFFGDSKRKTGAVYKYASANLWAQKISAHPVNLNEKNDNNYWNTYHITCNESTIKVELNEKLVSSSNNLPVELVQEGYIGLQIHTGRVQFRNIFIKEL